MYEDNEGANALAEIPRVLTAASTLTYVSISCAGGLRLEQVIIYSVASAEQHADILTKPLGREAFRWHREFLMNLS